MSNKIAIITGANSGIGKAAAIKFAAEGCQVVMACRNLAISKAVQQEIVSKSGNRNVDLMQLDVSSLASVRSFCTMFIAKYPHLDVLIHNAAYLNHGEKEYKLSPEGIELSFATNVCGPYWLSCLLADHLAKSADARILHACTTNIKHFFDPKRKIEFDNLQGQFRGERPYNVYKMYGDSKMALLMLTFKLAEEWRDRGIKVNALQINRVKLSEETIRKMHGIWKLLARAQNVINPMPEGMADNYYRICTSEQWRETTGQLFNHRMEIVQPSVSERGFAQVKNVAGSHTYPQYARQHEHIEQVWRLCQITIP